MPARQCSTTHIVSHEEQPGSTKSWLVRNREPTAWGSYRPYQYRADGNCSRCSGERDTSGRYCRNCRKLYNRALRAKQRAAA